MKNFKYFQKPWQIKADYIKRILQTKFKKILPQQESTVIFMHNQWFPFYEMGFIISDKTL